MINFAVFAVAKLWKFVVHRIFISIQSEKLKN